MSIAALVLSALLGATTPPDITSVYPTPLPLGATVDVTGTGFLTDNTSVTLTATDDPLATPVVQSIVYVLPDTVRFIVPLASPVGTATLQVTTPHGFDETTVEVVPAPPYLQTVEPDPVVLGELITIGGVGLEVVDGVTLGGQTCEISAQNTGLIVCVAPLGVALVGTEIPLVTGSPYGDDELLVTTTTPTPVIDLLAPNPVRQGDLLTVKGSMVPYLISGSIGGQDAIVVEAHDNELVLAVPLSAPLGAVEVAVSVGSSTSAPAGPLWIDPADPDRPTVTGLYPAAVVQGGSAWAIGRDLDDLSWSTEGLEADTCDDKACLLTFPDAPPGAFSGALGDSDGASVISVQILEDTGQAHPVITDVTPNPAFVGESLTLHGEDLHEVDYVLIGGVVQPIDFLDTAELRITVTELTPRGAERVFVAGASGSNPVTVTVLDPFPTASASDVSGPDTSGNPTGEPDSAGPSPDSTDNPSPDSGDPPTATGSSGCQSSAPHHGPLAVVCALCLAWMTRRRLFG